MQVKALSGKPQILKEVNTSIIERLVFDSGPLSRPELAKRTGLSLPTINKLVDDLEKNDRLCSVGKSGKGAGRKAMLYETNRNLGCILSCFYQDGYFKCRLVDMLNKTLHEKSFPLHCSTFQRALESTTHMIDSLMELAPATVKIIGLGLPGVVRPDGRIVEIPQISVWERFNLKQALVSRYGVAVYIENNVNLSAMGFYFNRLRDKQENIVYLYVGNGIGSGIIINRQLYQGSGNYAGEIAFMADGGKAAEQNYVAAGGCLESHMAHLVDFSSGELREKDNPVRRRELIATVSAIAVNYIAILNPGMIVLGGKIFDKSLVEDIKLYMRNYLHTCIRPRIIRDLNSNTGLEGLTKSCREFITTEIHLVHSAGLPETQTRMAV